MGLFHITAALKMQLKPVSTKFTLIALANATNDADGFAWISLQTIEEFTGLSERAIRMALRDLEDKGILITKRRKQATSIYHLNLIHPSPADIAALDIERIVQERQPVPPRPATSAPEPEYNQKIKDRASKERPRPTDSAGQGASDARAFSESWRPDAALTAWFDERFPEVDMDAQVEAFINKNLAGGVPVVNPASAFKGFCAHIPNLKLPPKPRARPGTKAAEVESNWSDKAARIAAMRRTISLYEKMGGRSQEIADIEAQIRFMEGDST